MIIRTLIATILPAICSALELKILNLSPTENHGLSRRETGIRAMCWWDSPSSSIIRDQVFINGGSLKLANITEINGTPELETNDIPTLSYYLNLGNAFNISDVPFETIKTDFLQVTDGFMAANDNSFWLYGGLVGDTDSIQSVPDSDEIEVYDVYRQGPERIWEAGWQKGAVLSNGVNRYVSSGAGVNVRELNQTYYFSGARNANWSEIRGPGAVRDRFRANLTSSQLIRGDLTDQVRTAWTNTTLPKQVRPRINAEMVYLPTGTQGTLVVIGGVTSAEWLKPSAEEEDSGEWEATIEEAVRTGPSFLKTVEIYDISSQAWYLQNTTGDIPPTGLAQHCAIAASAKDGSSHQIYVYGGYPGYIRDQTRPIPYYDDVYVLSIPAFEWVKVHNGTSSLARKGHKCVKPLPDQMFVIGGRPQGTNTCIDMVRVFNLNKLEFMPAYDPAIYEEYKVPSAIRDVIGGDENGGATKTVSRWADPTLASIFVSETPPMKVYNWYPYTSVAPTGTPTSTVSIIQTKSEVPKYVYPVIAVCIVLVLLIVGACIAFFCIRRKRQREESKVQGHEQFQSEDKKDKYDPYPPYPSPQTSPYGTTNSVSTLGQSYANGYSRQYSTDGYSQDQGGANLHELSAERRPVELDAGQEFAKLAVVQENSDAFSIVPTPATEAEDPLSNAGRQPSQRTARRSVFSEMTNPSDDGGISPLSPDPELASASPPADNVPAAQVEPSAGGWWKKMGSKNSGRNRRFSSFSSSKSAPKSPS